MVTRLYELLDADGTPRYIGKTIHTLEHRLSRHLREAKKGRYHRAYWIRQQQELGRPITIRLVREVEGTGAAEEIALIAEYRKAGIDLVNTTEGGEGILGFKFSDESRTRMSTAHQLLITSEWRVAQAQIARTVWKNKSPEEKARVLARLASAAQAAHKASLLRQAEKRRKSKEEIRALRSERVREWHAKMTPEERAKRADTYRRAIALRSDARRAEIAEQSRRAVDPAQASIRAKKQWALRTLEERKRIGALISKGKRRQYELQREAKAECAPSSGKLPAVGRTQDAV